MDEEELLRVEATLPCDECDAVQDTQALAREVRRLNAIVKEIQPATAEAVRYRQLLIEYGRHNEGCNAQWGDTYRCRCGWREVEREFIAPADQTGTSVGRANGT